MNPNSNAIKLYNKMQKRILIMLCFASGSSGERKVSPLYTSTGAFDEPFQSQEELDIPLKQVLEQS
jgi:hypothetical protein